MSEEHTREPSSVDQHQLEVVSPVSGTTVAMVDVPDAVFAGEMVGPGIAVRPESGYADALAPIDGSVATLHPHAFVVARADGRAVLVHLGIDTVKEQGAGFTLHVVQGESVQAGQPLVGWDPDAVVAAGYSALVPVVALDASAEALTVGPAGTAIEAGAPLLDWHG